MVRTVTGEADVQIGDTVTHLTDPERFTDPKRRLMPLPVRIFLGLQRVHGFLRMRHATGGGSKPADRAA